MTPNGKRFEEHFVSIIIPAFRAEKFIESNLIQVRSVLHETRYSYEIICVVDGDVDNTKKKAQKVSDLYSEVRVIGYSENMGKGHAVRFGMAKSRGDIVGFIDAGIELNPNGLSMLLEHFEWYKADIIVGSKRHPASRVVYPWQRKVLSFGYQILVRVLFGLKVRDTQVGLKFFRREVLERILPRVLVKTFAFDVELLSVAYYLGYKRIFEAPVELEMKFKGGISTIASKGFIKTAWGMLWDTAAVFYRLRILHYYDDKNKNKWITQSYLTLNNKL